MCSEERGHTTTSSFSNMWRNLVRNHPSQLDFTKRSPKKEHSCICCWVGGGGCSCPSLYHCNIPFEDLEVASHRDQPEVGAGLWQTGTSCLFSQYHFSALVLAESSGASQQTGLGHALPVIQGEFLKLMSVIYSPLYCSVPGISGGTKYTPEKF